MIKKIQRIQKIWASQKNNWGDYAQPNKNEENKEKELKPDTRGQDKSFWKEMQKKKVRKQAQVILSLEIP
jgi:glycyl-tRNA synthetase beta subunit